MKFEGATICGVGVVAAPPLHNNATATAANNAATQGIVIAQIAPVDKPPLPLCW